MKQARAIFKKQILNQIFRIPRTAERDWIEHSQSIHRGAGKRLSGIVRENS